MKQNGAMNRPLRVKFLIEREVQFQIVGYILFIWFISTLAMVYLVDSSISATIDSMVLESLEGDRGQLTALLDLKSNIRMFGIVGIVIGTIGSLVGGIIVSHRVAGPIFALRRALNLAAESGVLEKIEFRKGDFTKNLAESYNRLVDRFRK
jgi:hypothetical protein